MIRVFSHTPVEKQFFDLKKFRFDSINYTPKEPAISPSKPINILLKTDCYNETTYIRPLSCSYLLQLIRILYLCHSRLCSDSSYFLDNTQ